jgi:hypothetical protein
MEGARMIISASRRTDMPAFFPEETINHILDMYYGRYSHGHLDPISCVVFWTKDARPIMPYIPRLLEKGIPFYFQHTMTIYGHDLEPNVNDKRLILQNMVEIARLYGRDRIVWRYDPIIINDKYNRELHLNKFYYLCEYLTRNMKGDGAYVSSNVGTPLEQPIDTCVISFCDLQYRKLWNVAEQHNFARLSDAEQMTICKELVAIARQFGIHIEACCEKFIYGTGITAARCIDPERIEKLCKYGIIREKDSSQRQLCGCVKSIDIGRYGTCQHGCVYCYA